MLLSRNTKILVVDDDADWVELLQYNLKKAGFSIGTAFDGIEAVSKARSILPDLILLDLMLPEMDGFAVCEILRRDKTTASIPIVIITALSGELGRLVGLDSGASAYIAKPFSPKLLIARLENVLRGQEKSSDFSSSFRHSRHDCEKPDVSHKMRSS
jgi:DNA-binding response OmpR family regulator